MTEGLRYIRWSWVAFGWFISAAVTSLVLLALFAFGAIGVEEAPGDAVWVAQALLTGFFLGGFFVGARVVGSPIMHGLLMGLFSVVAWFLINLLVGEPTGQTTWRSLGLGNFLGLLLIQTVAAVVGTRLGSRWARRPPATGV